MQTKLPKQGLWKKHIGEMCKNTMMRTTPTSTFYEKILLKCKGHFKITDFGLVMLYLNKKMAGIVGTVPFVAPKVNQFTISKKNISIVFIFLK